MSNPIFETEYKDVGLNLVLYENFLSKKESKLVFDFLEENIEYTRNITDKLRVNKTFGNDGLEYIVNFSNGSVIRKAEKWNPVLLAIRDRVQRIMKEECNICVCMRYPNGQVGIKSHRDKEMKRGTCIAGVSIGETRVLTMMRGQKKYDITLPPGSMYVFYPPTNDHWSHCIEKDNTKNPRVSLTFRNYTPLK